MRSFMEGGRMFSGQHSSGPRGVQIPPARQALLGGGIGHRAAGLAEVSAESDEGVARVEEAAEKHQQGNPGEFHGRGHRQGGRFLEHSGESRGGREIRKLRWREEKVGR